MEAGAPLPTTVPGIDHTANIHLRWGNREERPEEGEMDNRQKAHREKTK